MKILCIGYGKMGSSIIQRVLSCSTDYQMTVVDTDYSKHDHELVKKYPSCISFMDNLSEQIDPDMILFAVKPQECDDVVDECVKLYPKPILLSIMAGKSIAFFEQKFGQDIKVIRLMPNLGAKFGYSNNIGIYNKNLDEVSRIKSEKFMSLFGFTYWLEDEKSLDIFTAISGSSMAYFMWLANEIKNFAIRHGVKDSDAAEIISNVVLSSGMFAKEDSKNPDIFSNIIGSVSSKGGITEKGIDFLNNKVQLMVEKLLDTVIERSKVI